MSRTFQLAIRMAVALLASVPLLGVARIAVAQEKTNAEVQADETASIQDDAARRADAEKTFKKNVTQFVNKYCVDCHGSRPEAGINLRSALNTPGAASSALHWKKAVANVKVNDMPPHDAGQLPTEEERQQFVQWIGKLKYLAPRDPGTFVIRRLSKVEYGNTLRDLYGVDVSIADSLPDEVVGEGYLNSISPMQSERFLEIANKVIEKVVASEGKSPTVVQQRLFGPAPAEGADLRQAARVVARSLARNGYRRPPTEAELDVLVDVFDLGQENNLSYTKSLAFMLKAVLVSPQFLFITPAANIDSKDKIVPLDDHQLASRLSYLLWSAPPDAELAKLADNGQLQNPDVLRQQAERLLLHPRSRALFDSFGAQWLGISQLEQQTFDPQVFPQMTPALRQAMVDEARLLFQSIVQDNESIYRFVDSDYTFLNQPLAEVYGLNQAVEGLEMRRVKLDNPNRGGILGMPATLASTSFPNRTSPVKRGVWVLEQVLGERVPPPPPNVPELEDLKQENLVDLSLRQQTELHQSEPTCANCHKVLDPIGFGLENFDAIGRWRETYNNGPAIDSTGKLPAGERFTTPAELKSLLADRKADIARNLTERLMAFTLGRQLEGYDEIVVDKLMLKIAKDDYRMRTMIAEVVTCYLFTHRKVKG
jgi:mono/diheme cytochrome c family protein